MNEKPFRLLLEYNGIDKILYFHTWNEAWEFLQTQSHLIDDWDINGY